MNENDITMTTLNSTQPTIENNVEPNQQVVSLDSQIVSILTNINPQSQNIYDIVNSLNTFEYNLRFFQNTIYIKKKAEY